MSKYSLFLCLILSISSSTIVSMQSKHEIKKAIREALHQANILVEYAQEDDFEYAFVCRWLWIPKTSSLKTIALATAKRIAKSPSSPFSYRLNISSPEKFETILNTMKINNNKLRAKAKKNSPYALRLMVNDNVITQLIERMQLYQQENKQIELKQTKESSNYFVNFISNLI